MQKIFLFCFVILFSSCGNKSSEEHITKKPELTKDSSSTETITKKPSEQNKENLISIIAVGDIMMGSNYPTNASLPPNDGRDILSGVSEALQNADITLGNLEGTLLNSGGKAKDCGEHCHAFRMPEHYAEYLKDAGFDYMNLANNHSGDFGVIGRESTKNTLESYGIKYGGLQDAETSVMEVGRTKIGFAGFAPNWGTCDINNLSKAKEIVSDLKKECDIVVVCFHGGAEGTGAQRVRNETEYYLGEKRGNVVEFSHGVIEAGADLVLGSGPHVARAMELYEGKFIAYSLGNFCTYGKFGLAGVLGLAPILKVYVDGKGKFVKGEIISVQQKGRGIPEIDETNKSAQIISKLTQMDFTNSKINIDGDGIITIDN
ncbi:MAG: CapA family protein [Bacteroidetes bacterium]|nr:CapA family protein [Bacteroidota bacterium]